MCGNDSQAITRQVQAWQGKAEMLTTTTVSASIPRRKLKALASLAAVNYVEASTKLKLHSDLAHRSARLFRGNTRTVPQTGQGVLIGIIDSGIDVNHPAFQVNGRTRIINYLDQTSDSEFDAGQIDAGAAANSKDIAGHGTHVAGIAAGNGAGSPGNRFRGLAHEADLVIVKTTLDSRDIAAAVQHTFRLAGEREQACVINLSLGGHVGPHDGTTVTERTIDELSGPGRIVVVSAGNEGGDFIHADTVDRTATTPDRWVADFRINVRELDTPQGGTVQAGLIFIQVWHQREDQIRLQLRSPTGTLFSAPDEGSQEFSFNTHFIEAIHQRHPYSDDHSTSFLVITDPQPQLLGGWSIIAEENRDAGGVQVGSVHAWIRDSEEGQFTDGATRSHLVGMPGTAFSAITVASYATRNEWRSRAPNAPNGMFRADAVNRENISFFSSMGPTRDGHNKLEIAAPGQLLLAPLSQDAPEEEIPRFLRVTSREYAALQGTSMAAPYVTGAVALLLEKNPRLDWAEMKRRLIKSAEQDQFTRPCWNARWGYGKLNVERLLTIEPE